MKKRIVSLLLVVCLVASALSNMALADETKENLSTSGQLTDDEQWEYAEYKDGVTLTQYLGSSTDVYVPGTVIIGEKEYNVIKLGDNVFENNDSLNSVTLGVGIKEIGARTFFDADNMVCVLTSEELETIGDEAFYSCDNFNSIILYDAIKSIGANVFAECPKLTVWCNEGTVGHTYVQENVVSYKILNPNAEPETIVQEGITYYVMNGEAIAIDCASTVTSIVVPATINGYPVLELRRTFKGNSSLKEVTLSEGLKTISANAFEGSGITSISIPDTVTSVGSSAFSECASLTSIKFSKSMSEIANDTFHSCSKLSAVSIPGNIKKIGSYSFFNCDALKEITISSGVTYIGDRAFDFCDSYTEIRIPGTVQTIGSGAFCCSSLKTVILENGVKDIGTAFWSSGITTIELPESIEKIATYAFDKCRSLTKITIPSNVKTISNGAFRDCTNLSEVVIEEGVTTIGAEAFSSCSKIEKILIPQSITKMEGNSFAKNTILLVYEDSYAHTYIKNKDVLFFAIRTTNNPEISYGTEVTGVVTYSNGTPAVNAIVDILYDDGTVKETVTTDANGIYEFTYAEVGQYTIRATDELGNTSTQKVTVKRMNVFEVFLTGDTNLILKQGWTVNGTVNENNAAITLTDEEGNVIQSIITEGGTFELQNVPNGTYVLKAEAEHGFVTKEITIFNGDVSALELIIAADTATIWGHVEVEDREGIQHRRNWVHVTAYNNEGNAVAQCKSDNDGKYEFKNLPLGEYAIVAEMSEMRKDKKLGYERSYTLSGYAYVDVAVEGTYQVDTIILYEENETKTTICGKVTANGEHQACEVTLRNVFRYEVANQTTGNNGKYLFKNICDGLYFIIATTESDGMGYTVVVVRNGSVYGETDIKVLKSSKVKALESVFYNDVPECETKEEVLQYRERIAQEKNNYDALSKKEKKQLSTNYVNRLNQYCEWLANCENVASEGVVLEQSGLVISGDELQEESAIKFSLSVEKKAKHELKGEGIQNSDDYLQHSMEDAAQKQHDYGILEYYEITMTKQEGDKEQAITRVYKDTDATGKFRITMEIPEEYRGYKHYSFIHVHKGEVVTLVDLDEDPNTVTFEVDAFSTFALLATDEEQIGQTVIGDVDDNGILTTDDAIYLQYHVMNSSQYPVDQDVDFDGNGYVTSDDAIYLLYHIMMPEKYLIKKTN